MAEVLECIRVTIKLMNRYYALTSCLVTQKKFQNRIKPLPMTQTFNVILFDICRGEHSLNDSLTRLLFLWSAFLRFFYLMFF